MVRRHGLRDDQWERIRGLLAGRAGHVGVTAKDNRLFVDAVLYRYRAGIPWRDLPEHYGPWKAVHTRFTRWAKRGVWVAVFAHLASDADPEYAMIDSTIVRAHQHSAGAKGGDRDQEAIGRADDQDPRHHRCPGQPDRLSSHAGPCPRFGRGRRPVAGPGGRRAARRQSL
jgi:transposase